MSDDDSRLVYSTEGGRVPERRAAAPSPAKGDGVVRVGRTSSGRRGKTVTLVTGLPAGDVAGVAKELKRLCGSGGAVKDGVVEIQGDQRARIIAHLEGRYRVKATGG
ncbi:MAG: translation initiation factor [Thermoleophilia bacterium]